MKTTLINRISVVLLQAVIILVGIGTLAFLLGEPHFEGRNVNATLFEIYFKDPFLAYVYVASIPFFVALYQAFRVLGNICQSKAFSPDSVRALGTIKYCATALVALVGGALGFIVFVPHGEDDIAGGVAMGLFILLISVIIAISAAVLEKRVRNTMSSL